MILSPSLIQEIKARANAELAGAPPGVISVRAAIVGIAQWITSIYSHIYHQTYLMRISCSAAAQCLTWSAFDLIL
jgi:hypothetical protein